MDNVKVSYYLAFPKSPKNIGVIIIQEWWGLNQNIKDLTIKFADKGYSSLAPDLYHNKVVEEPNEAQKLAMSLNYDTALKEVGESIVHIKNFCKKLVITGFCMGGFLALKTGEKFKVDGILAFYPGRYSPSVEDIKKYTSPVHIFVGDKDGSYDEKKYFDISNKFEEENKDFSFHLFGGAKHAYMNDQRDSFNKEASEQSFELIWKFLESLE